MHLSYIYWYSVIICLIPVTSLVEKVYLTPNISDPTKYCIIIACTVTVQLPMRVLQGVCYSYTSGGDDQSPNAVYYSWAIVKP
jgi:hypothetical protein